MQPSSHSEVYLSARNHEQHSLPYPIILDQNQATWRRKVKLKSTGDVSASVCLLCTNIPCEGRANEGQRPHFSLTHLHSETHLETEIINLQLLCLEEDLHIFSISPWLGAVTVNWWLEKVPWSSLLDFIKLYVNLLWHSKLIKDNPSRLCPHLNSSKKETPEGLFFYVAKEHNGDGDEGTDESAKPRKETASHLSHEKRETIGEATVGKAKVSQTRRRPGNMTGNMCIHTVVCPEIWLNGSARKHWSDSFTVRMERNFIRSNPCRYWNSI